MHILVTGGAGYLGSVLTPLLLARGHQVRVLDSLRYGINGLEALVKAGKVELAVGDLRCAGDVSRALTDIDAVVHLAAIVGDPACARLKDEAWDVNHRASIDLFTLAATKSITRVIFASTCSNYGKMSADVEYLDEGAPLRPVSLYAESKVGVEKWLFGTTGPVTPVSTVLRFATLYGVSDRMRFDLTVNELTATLASGRKLIVFGEQFWRPYVHVYDAARAIAMVLDAPANAVAGEMFNVGATSENYRKADIVRLLLDRLPGASVEYVHHDEDPRDYKVSCEKIRRQLGFVPTRVVPDGIAEIADAMGQGRFKDYDDTRFRN